MHVQDIFQSSETTFSFEFFPPRSPEAVESLYQTIRELEPYQPHFVSVTYGAGGATRELTHDLVVRIKETTSLDPVPHLTCVCHKEHEITEILDRYPGTPNRLLELDYLKRKVDAGADYIVTQLFFDNRDFFDFRDRCELAAITVPIIAGIMPIISIAGMKRMAELAAGARFPARLLRSLQRCHDDPESVARVGVHYASEQCHDLLEHKVRGIHFYTLNRSDATRRIFESLGLKQARARIIQAA